MQQILETPPIVAALIAFTGVFITQCIVIVGLVLTERRIVRELNRKDTGKLIELRLTCYPQAYSITEQLRGRKIFTVDAPNFGTLVDELEKWSEGLPLLVMSGESLEKFYDLKIRLREILETAAPYGIDHLKGIRSSNSAFRNALRQDIGLLHFAESQQEAK
jgi:hypothetical protein